MTTVRGRGWTERVVIAPAERREAVLNIIRRARRHLTLSLFRCNDDGIFVELARAVDRGVRVDVLVTQRSKGKKKLRRLWEALDATGAAVHPHTDPVVKYHAKYLVADEGPAMVASLNFTTKCFRDTVDAVVITHDAAVVDGLRRLHAADRDSRGIPEGLPDRLIVGPERARRQFTALIEGAQSSIRLIDPKLSDPALTRVLDERRRDGIAVEVHGKKRLNGLRSHGKLLLIDHRIAVVGSLALAALSLDFRREVAIRVDDRASVSAIARLFDSLVGATRAPRPARAAAGRAAC